MKRKVNQKGVTLVALVVTIIVLIILAGVSINLLLGENGIITKAKEAAQNTQIAEIEEKKKLEDLERELNEALIGNTTISPETYYYTVDVEGNIIKDNNGTVINYIKSNDKYYRYSYDKENKKWVIDGQEVNITDLNLVAYTTATSDNVTVGKAAYADGILLLGNDADGQKNYEQGYEDGKKAGKLKRIVVGTGAGAVKQALPEIYDQLTIENFALGNVTAVPGRHGGNSGSVDGYYNIAGYDSASGTVSVSVRQGDPGNAEIFIRSFSTNVYCYYIDNE